MVACFGLPVFHEGAVYNAAAVACDGRLLGLVAKQHLAGDGIHYEPRWFRRWPAGEVGTIEVGGQGVSDRRLAVRLRRRADRPGNLPRRLGRRPHRRRLAQRGADVLLNPSASHFAFAKQQIRERFVLEGSRAFCVSYAYCNLLGNEAGRSIYDGGTLIARGGKMLVRGPRFSFADWLLTTAVIDVDSTRRAKAESFPDASPRARRSTTAWSPSTSNIPTSTSRPAASTDVERRRRESASVRHAAARDIRHGKRARIRRRKNSPARWRSRCSTTCGRAARKGFVVSLSGGADSSAVAVLVHLMVQFGVPRAGLARVRRKAAAHRATIRDRDAGEHEP